jgi:hypothetical protein
LEVIKPRCLKGIAPQQPAAGNGKTQRVTFGIASKQSTMRNQRTRQS